VHVGNRNSATVKLSGNKSKSVITACSLSVKNKKGVK
jgi:hypothetical protein